MPTHKQSQAAECLESSSARLSLRSIPPFPQITSNLVSAARDQLTLTEFYASVHDLIFCVSAKWFWGSSALLWASQFNPFYWWVLSHCMDRSESVHLADGHLGCFLFWSNKWNCCEHSCASICGVYVSISVEQTSRNGIAGLYDRYLFFFLFAFKETVSFMKCRIEMLSAQQHSTSLELTQYDKPST